MDSYGAMVHGNFLNGDQRDELETIMRQPSARHGVARRANAILLLDDGLVFEKIAKVLYTDDSTIRAWRKTYILDGFKGLERFDWKGAKSYLAQQQKTTSRDR